MSTTGVIEAGEPAIAPATVVDLYWVRGGRVEAVPRAASGDPGGVAAALALLFDGPTSADTAKGYRTELPALPGPPKVWTKDGAAVAVVLPGRPGALTPAALRQVVCTAAAAVLRPPGGSPRGAAATAVPRVASPAPGAPATVPPVSAPAVTVTVTASGRTTAHSSRGCP